ncbi:hypothetical protein [Rhodopirellula sp. MGV]|uniref:hypothetical protein n=1 Tax=Rhodopirellula sp. MGV TaxID=2023130 RepID=UPI000B97B06D|nr:hypothetical protein [Rhodopirellula sp. MGV]PNY35884.1 hypothetical protein C2E31_15580 [Rhodopirellula baltica]
MNIEIDHERLIVVPYTNFAATLLLTGCISAIAAVGVLIGAFAEMAMIYFVICAGLIGVSTLGFFLYTRLEERYRFELGERVLYFDRSFLGVRRSKKIAAAQDINCVIAQGHAYSVGRNSRRPPRFKYAALLVTSNGKRYELLPPNEVDFSAALSKTRQLARIFGCNALGEARKLTVVRGKAPPRIEFENHRNER